MIVIRIALHRRANRKRIRGRDEFRIAHQVAPLDVESRQAFGSVFVIDDRFVVAHPRVVHAAHLVRVGFHRVEKFLGVRFGVVEHLLAIVHVKASDDEGVRRNLLDLFPGLEVVIHRDGNARLGDRAIAHQVQRADVEDVDSEF